MAAAANRAADTALLLNFGRSRLESDLARWALLGRTSDQALSILNGRGEGVANNAPSVAAE